jgi:hypothetical protein
MLGVAERLQEEDDETMICKAVMVSIIKTRRLTQ